jgi:phosphate transport system substrate-binding protein
MIVFLIAVIGVEVALFQPTRPPLDCGSGMLTAIGSTAFAPVVADATDSYKKSCGDANFTVTADDSDKGLGTLSQEGAKLGQTPPMVTFSDGEKRAGFPNLIARPIAFVLFSVVINPKANVLDLSPAQLGDLFAGRITNWKQIGGANLPVVLVSRQLGSGTRTTFESKVLHAVEAPANSMDCQSVYDKSIPGPAHCQESSTADMLATVTGTDGAIGYSELGAATARGHDLVIARIGSRPADVDHAMHYVYPFWQTEYAYTYGEPKADSLLASFLRYLTNQVGIDVIRAHGDVPCSDMENPVLCGPPPR